MEGDLLLRLRNLLRPSHGKRVFFFLIVDVILLCGSFYLSFDVRFSFVIPDRYFTIFLHALPFVILFKIPVFFLFGLYSITWRYVGLVDFYNILKGNIMGSLILVLFIFFFKVPFLEGFPRSILVIDFFVSVLVTSTVRISKRAYLELVRKDTNGIGRKVLIIGAGNVGEMIVRDMRRSGKANLQPVGFLDDDETKVGSFVHGVKVLGCISELPEIVSRIKPDMVVIAIPSLRYTRLREIYKVLKEHGVADIKIVPRLYGDSVDMQIRSLEDIKIEDLLGREEVHIDASLVRNFITGRRVLVTGAAGSIGSEIIRQVCLLSPKEIVLFDVDETELYELELDIGIMGIESEKITAVVGDIVDFGKLSRTFEKYRPEVVFHAAAYKHVPMMEYYPEEAVRVNILGTYNLCKVSVNYDVEKFVLISTDKAVNPTSVMGATKRVSEYIGIAFNMLGKTKFVAVRFGNVLGSRGSVIPIFLKQLKKGGPLTVTHPEVQRYFMTIPEAVALVLQAAAIGEGGEVMVLDMKDPVKIVSLAEELIRLHGLEPYKDIDIVFTGLRPGEKMYEELLTAEEGTMKTGHGRIFKANISKIYTLDDVDKMVKEFKDAVTKGSAEEIKRLLHKYVATYRYS
ncbi:MAG: polysaccharide biosynthesis protein [Synergistetes bacterium]|nr:polysaccharide biosynthesis protein [Synergistota bacterium]